MLRETMIQEIIDMKLKGYSINEIVEHYEKNPGTPPSKPTIRNGRSATALSCQRGMRRQGSFRYWQKGAFSPRKS